MNFIDAVKSVFTNYANFNGRARRSEYWWYILFSIIVSQVLSLISPTSSLVFSLATFIPSLAVGVRRMHDVGKSGWFLLIPIYNIILAATNGDSGSNEYGSDPKGYALEEEINAIGNN
jgi:uncharacterized membrane protein YhaH (DUF805 family)